MVLRRCCLIHSGAECSGKFGSEVYEESGDCPVRLLWQRGSLTLLYVMVQEDAEAEQVHDAMSSYPPTDSIQLSPRMLALGGGAFAKGLSTGGTEIYCFMGACACIRLEQYSQGYMVILW